MKETIGENIKAVFFDHDDTLVATRESKVKQHKHFARVRFGKELQDDEILLHWHKSLPELIRALYGANNFEEVFESFMSLRDQFPKTIFEGSAEILTKLHNKGKLIGIISGTSKESLENDFRVLGFPREMIDYVQGVEDTLFHKPDPRVFEPAINWLQGKEIKANEALYVGDNLSDMEAAKGAGLLFVGVETGLVSAQEFLSHNITSYPTIGDISKLIR